MADIFAVRNVDKKAQDFIYDYAHKHDVNTGKALAEIVSLAEEHLKEKEQKRKINRAVVDEAFGMAKHFTEPFVRDKTTREF